MFDKISLKAAIFTFLICFTVTAVGLTGFLAFYSGNRAVNDVARQLREEVTQRIYEHVREYLWVPHRINRANAEALRGSRAAWDDQDALVSRFSNQISLFPSVSSIYFGNTRGGLANSGREASGDARYIIVTDDFSAGNFRKYALDDMGERGEETIVLSSFDARSRPWYARAVARGDSVWSDIYILFTGQDMALAASRPIYSDQGHVLGVASVDVFLSHLSVFLQKLRIGTTGRAFILERNGLLVAGSQNETFVVNHDVPSLSRRIHGLDSGDPAVREAVRALTEHFGGIHRIVGMHHLDFHVQGKKHFLQVTTLEDPWGIDWVIVVLVPEADFMARIDADKSAIWALMFLLLGLALMAAAFLARGIVHPVSALDKAASNLAAGSEPEEIQETSRFIEVDGLTRSFNRMARRLSRAIADLQNELDERKQMEAERERLNLQLLQAQKMESVGILAAGVAHDFNNLLQIIAGNVQLLLNTTPQDHPAADRLRTVLGAADRAAQLVRKLLLFSRKSKAEPKRVDLNHEVWEGAKMIERTIPRMITVKLALDPDAWPLHADPVQIEQVLLNLGSNAADAMPDGGTLLIETANVNLDDFFVENHPDVKPGAYVLLKVSDTGEGMGKDILDHIYDPFFTTKEVGKGTGLGLPTVYGIVKTHRGHIRCESSPGQGTSFSIYWPAVREMGEVKVVEREGDGGNASLPEGTETILVVDDEEDIRDLSEQIMKSLGYTVLSAADGEEALAIHARYGKKIDLVLLDLSMPGMGGRKCMEKLLQRDPSIKILIASGYAANETGVLAAGASGFISKPYLFAEFMEKVCEMLNKGAKSGTRR